MGVHFLVLYATLSDIVISINNAKKKKEKKNKKTLTADFDVSPTF